MSNDIHETQPGTSLPTARRSPRQLTEALVGLLRQGSVSAANLEVLVRQLEESLDQCFAARRADGLYEDALQRAPWLTADSERLKQQQTALRQSLQAFGMLASRGGGSPESLVQRFDEFTELFLEHEAAEQNFLQTAFPAPDWTEEC